MARITEEELARLKAGVSLERLCVAYGIELKGHGKDLLGRCPFHEDRTPSFVVTPGKNLWNCLGACGCGGDNLQLVMKKEGVSFRRAVERLREMLGEAPPVAVVKTRLGTQHAALIEPGVELEDAELLGHVVDYYHRTFLNEAAAMAYLQKRKCFHPEAVKVFRLGFANRTLGYRVPATTAEGRKLKGQLQRLGVLRGTGHEHLNGSVIVPLWACGPGGEPGPVAQLYGRKITANLREGTPEHLYLPGPQRGVWNAAGVAGQREWLVCEALLDALTLWCAGFRNVTSAYGVNGWTAEHWALFDAKPPERVILCFDNDEAGNQAATRLGGEMELRGVKVWRGKLPPGLDINEVARESSDVEGALAEIIEASPRIFALNAATELPKCVAMVVDELTGEPLPIVDYESLTTGAGWAPEGFEPASYEEVQAAAKAVPESAAALPALAESKPEVSSALADAEKSSSLAALAAAETEDAAKIKSAEPMDGDAHAWTFGERQWRVRGIAKNPSYETLRVQLRVLVEKRTGPVFHLDTLDLCNAKHRANFVEAAHLETGAGAEHLKRDLAQVLLKAEEQQEAFLRKTSEPAAKTVALSPMEETAALGLLRDPRLLDRILEDFERCGVVGEATNKLVGYLAAVSRKLDAPLAVIVQSTSAAGKSSLLEAVLAFVPEEERIKYSAMTGQSLYYLGDTELKHKVLAIVEEEGAERASYALKLLQSEGELTIASTGKDPHSGRMVTQEYHVQGPVMILLTTTAIDVDEELLNRCLVLTVDESREQTRAIHELQREARTLDGLRRKLDKAAILSAHRNAQRLLKPVRVVNPWARRLTFIDDRTRTRRDHEKYLTLIDAIAFLHQYQRPMRQDGARADYIEATLEDIATANRLAGEVLGRSLDELPPQTRRLLRLIDDLVEGECRRLKIQRSDYRFSRRDVRAFTGWGNTQLKVHLHRLEEMEYLLVHRGGRGQSFVYELLYAGEGTDGSRFLPGLLDVTNLDNDGNRSGQKEEKSAPSRGEAGPEPGGCRGGAIAPEPCKHEAGAAAACVDAHFCATGEGKNDAQAQS